MTGKVPIVIRREFLSTVMRPSWLVGTFGMPVFVGLYAGLVFLVARTGDRIDKPVGKAAIVDQAGIVRFEQGPTTAAPPLPDAAKDQIDRAIAGGAGGEAASVVASVLSGTEFLPYETEGLALDALAKKEVGAVYVIPPDYVETGKITAYDASGSIFSEGKLAQAPLRRLMIKSLTAERMDEAVSERILSPLSVKTLVKLSDGTWAERGLGEIVRRFGVPFAFMVLLLISIVTSASTLIQGVSEEKESRVIEIILSSIDARSLLLGKLIGLGAAGLLQLAIWLTMAVVPILLMIAGVTLSPVLVLMCMVYFILGFFLYGTLITATGVIGTTARDMQQWGMFWVIGVIPPMAFFEVLLRKPHGTTARILSYIPLTSPSTMMLRIGAGQVPIWEVLLTLGLLVLSVLVVLRFAARMFRTGLLMYGKRPTVPEIYRWLRQA